MHDEGVEAITNPATHVIQVLSLATLRLVQSVISVGTADICLQVFFLYGNTRKICGFTKLGNTNNFCYLTPLATPTTYFTNPDQCDGIAQLETGAIMCVIVAPFD